MGHRPPVSASRWRRLRLRASFQLGLAAAQTKPMYGIMVIVLYPRVHG